MDALAALLSAGFLRLDPAYLAAVLEAAVPYATSSLTHPFPPLPPLGSQPKVCNLSTLPCTRQELFGSQVHVPRRNFHRRPDHQPALRDVDCQATLPHRTVAQRGRCNFTINQRLSLPFQLPTQNRSNQPTSYNNLVETTVPGYLLGCASGVRAMVINPIKWFINYAYQPFYFMVTGSSLG